MSANTMAIVAKLKHLRMSPRKVRLVADAVRGMDADEAQIHLGHLNKRATLPILKLLKSAVANAEHNFQKNRALLFIQSLTVDKGPVSKRFRPRAFGRAADIHKYTSHIVLVLGERTTLKKKRFILASREKPKETGTLEEMGKMKKKPDSEFSPKDFRKEPQRDFRKRFVDIGRRFFQRKSV